MELVTQTMMIMNLIRVNTVATHRDHEHTAEDVPSMGIADVGSTAVKALVLSVPIVTSVADRASLTTDAARQR